MPDTKLRTYPCIFYRETDGTPMLSFPPARAIPLSRIFQLEQVAVWAKALLDQPGGTQTNSMHLRKALEELDG